MYLRLTSGKFYTGFRPNYHRRSIFKRNLKTGPQVQNMGQSGNKTESTKQTLTLFVKIRGRKDVNKVLYASSQYGIN